jgi:ABC-type branched-subunit amino acid transport system ATPase component
MVGQSCGRTRPANEHRHSKQSGVRLAVRGLHKSYHGNEVLKGIDIEVSPGEILVILDRVAAANQCCSSTSSAWSSRTRGKC